MKLILAIEVTQPPFSSFPLILPTALILLFILVGLSFLLDVTEHVGGKRAVRIISKRLHLQLHAR